jgi:IS30 family transposase
VHTAAQLASVAAELNARPRKILGWETLSQQLDRLLASVPIAARGATTAGIRLMTFGH